MSALRAGYEYSTFDAINHIRNSSIWTENVVPDTQFATDAASRNLQAVSWLVIGPGSEHPPNSTCQGENWTVQQLNASMQGPDWGTTALPLSMHTTRFSGFFRLFTRERLAMFSRMEPPKKR